MKISNISLKVQLYSCLGGLFRPLQIQKRPKSLQNDRKIKCDCGVVAIYERHAISTVSVISRLRSLMTGRYCHLDQREALPWFSKIAPGVDPPAKRNMILQKKICKKEHYPLKKNCKKGNIILLKPQKPTKHNTHHLPSTCQSQ